jgi:hypothetical protein
MLQSQLINYPSLGFHQTKRDVLNDAYIINDNDYDCISMKSGRSIISDDVSEAYEEMMEIIMTNNKRNSNKKSIAVMTTTPTESDDYSELPKLNKHSYFQPFSASRTTNPSSLNYFYPNRKTKDGNQTKLFVPANSRNNKTPLTVTTTSIDGQQFHTISYQVKEKQPAMNDESLKECN